MAKVEPIKLKYDQHGNLDLRGTHITALPDTLTVGDEIVGLTTLTICSWEGRANAKIGINTPHLMQKFSVTDLWLRCCSRARRVCNGRG